MKELPIIERFFLALVFMLWRAILIIAVSLLLITISWVVIWTVGGWCSIFVLLVLSTFLDPDRYDLIIQYFSIGALFLSMVIFIGYKFREYGLKGIIESYIAVWKQSYRSATYIYYGEEHGKDRTIQIKNIPLNWAKVDGKWIRKSKKNLSTSNGTDTED